MQWAGTTFLSGIEYDVLVHNRVRSEGAWSANFAWIFILNQEQLWYSRAAMYSIWYCGIYTVDNGVDETAGMSKNNESG